MMMVCPLIQDKHKAQPTKAITFEKTLDQSSLMLVCLYSHSPAPLFFELIAHGMTGAAVHHGGIGVRDRLKSIPCI
jgi:succinate dehydrogenase/fumarate reductase cytochrome b subunit